MKRKSQTITYLPITYPQFSGENCSQFDSKAIRLIISSLVL